MLFSISTTQCARALAALHAIGESVSEMLDWVPAQLRIIRTVRPKYACRSEKWISKRRRRRHAVSTDVRNRAVQAFWAMHVEAMNWSGMGVREYAAALQTLAASRIVVELRRLDGYPSQQPGSIADIQF
ncbi:IS66 family transposase zinc-finger binding domain-containing protein [Mesorhizobium sp. IMUNJ 23033]|uniref:IS66 family transposase zinc-finger binding domain-containing protein n=1 Tax=Mesorhizobium sp. IMUNJ 23033 TaxID=3378039 RepID=UPI00384EC5A6